MIEILLLVAQTLAQYYGHAPAVNHGVPQQQQYYGYGGYQSPHYNPYPRLGYHYGLPPPRQTHGFFGSGPPMKHYCKDDTCQPCFEDKCDNIAHGSVFDTSAECAANCGVTNPCTKGRAVMAPPGADDVMLQICKPEHAITDRYGYLKSDLMCNSQCEKRSGKDNHVAGRCVGNINLVAVCTCWTCEEGAQNLADKQDVSACPKDRKKSYAPVAPLSSDLCRLGDPKANLFCRSSCVVALQRQAASDANTQFGWECTYSGCYCTSCVAGESEDMVIDVGPATIRFKGTKPRKDGPRFCHYKEGKCVKTCDHDDRFCYRQADGIKCHQRCKKCGDIEQEKLDKSCAKEGSHFCTRLCNGKFTNTILGLCQRTKTTSHCICDICKDPAPPSDTGETQTAVPQITNPSPFSTSEGSGYGYANSYGNVLVPTFEPRKCLTQAFRTQCSSPCNGGVSAIMQHCDDVIERELIPCNTQPCPVDCEIAQWTSWSACSAPCGLSGETFRERPVIVPPMYGGKKCPNPLVQKYPCNRGVDCAKINPNYGKYAPAGPVVNPYDVAHMLPFPSAHAGEASLSIGVNQPLPAPVRGLPLPPRGTPGGQFIAPGPMPFAPAPVVNPLPVHPAPGLVHPAPAPAGKVPAHGNQKPADKKPDQKLPADWVYENAPSEVKFHIERHEKQPCHTPKVKMSLGHCLSRFMYCQMEQHGAFPVWRAKQCRDAKVLKDDKCVPLSECL